MAVGSAATAAGLLVWTRRRVGPASPWFALAAVWLPMTALGTVSHVVPIRLPPRWHRLRPVETDGRLHERLGVPVVKRLLRRGPATLFNPGLRLPAEPTPERIDGLANRMCTAEASHVVAGAAALAGAAHAAARGRGRAAIWMLVLDVVVNGYPVLLQRYNRVLLLRRFGPPSPTER
ncbi:MAG: hypothetical protein R2761_29640 [Acidimicrobiales bacterium]